MSDLKLIKYLIVCPCTCKYSVSTYRKWLVAERGTLYGNMGHWDQSKGDGKCNYCPKEMSGGISQLKYHLAKISCTEVTVCGGYLDEDTREALASIKA